MSIIFSAFIMLGVLGQVDSVKASPKPSSKSQLKYSTILLSGLVGLAGGFGVGLFGMLVKNKFFNDAPEGPENQQVVPQQNPPSSDTPEGETKNETPKKGLKREVEEVVNKKTIEKNESAGNQESETPITQENDPRYKGILGWLRKYRDQNKIISLDNKRQDLVVNEEEINKASERIGHKIKLIKEKEKKFNDEYESFKENKKCLEIKKNSCDNYEKYLNSKWKGLNKAEADFNKKNQELVDKQAKLKNDNEKINAFIKHNNDIKGTSKNCFRTL